MSLANKSRNRLSLANKSLSKIKKIERIKK